MALDVRERVSQLVVREADLLVGGQLPLRQEGLERGLTELRVDLQGLAVDLTPELLGP